VGKKEINTFRDSLYYSLLSMKMMPTRSFPYSY